MQKSVISIFCKKKLFPLTTNFVIKLWNWFPKQQSNQLCVVSWLAIKNEPFRWLTWSVLVFYACILLHILCLIMLIIFKHIQPTIDKHQRAKTQSISRASCKTIITTCILFYITFSYNCFAPSPQHEDISRWPLEHHNVTRPGFESTTGTWASAATPTEPRD